MNSEFGSYGGFLNKIFVGKWCCTKVPAMESCFESSGKLMVLNLAFNHRNYNFLDCNWFKKFLFSTNSLAKLLSDSLLSDSSISQSHSKLLFKSTNMKQLTPPLSVL